jgi:oligosaccharide repeat unit polymerase
VSESLLAPSKSPVLDAVYPGLLITAALAVPILMATQLTEWNSGAALLFINMIYSGVRLAIVAIRGRGRILQLFFWTFMWVFLGLAPLAQYVANDWPWPGGVSNALLWRAGSLVIASMVFYDIGLLIARKQDTSPLAAPKRVLNINRLKVGAVIAVIACVSQIVRIGPTTILSDRAARAASSGDTSSGAIEAALLVSVIFVIAYTFVRVKRAKALNGYWVTTFVLVGLTLFVSNPLSSSRYRFASVAGALFLALVWPATRRQMAALTAGLLLGLAFLFPLLNNLRKDNVVTAGDGILQYLRQGDYDAFQSIVNTISFVDERGTTFGNQALGALLFFVPRSVWPTKALDSGVVVAESRGYGFTNLSSPLQAEGYINGGVLGVIMVFVLLGLATSAMERRANSAQHLLSFTGLFVPIIAAYQVIMLRGSLLQSMAGFAIIVLVLWLITSPSKEEQPELSRSLRAKQAK